MPAGLGCELLPGPVPIPSRTGEVMRVYDEGDHYRVTVSEREVDDFNRRWPCSTLDGPYSFTFAKSNGDLVDMSGKGDGSEHVALSQDAQKYGKRKLRLGEYEPLFWAYAVSGPHNSYGKYFAVLVRCKTLADAQEQKDRMKGGVLCDKAVATVGHTGLKRISEVSAKRFIEESGWTLYTIRGY